ncbi:methyltransferase domain-containing protein [Streptomyces sp. x-80]|uniref:class I SAM-dependent methyltransferase n=1 Tax=Streptomyces sp. x-80 TaxID=2789282 RepID=UPI00397EE659
MSSYEKSAYVSGPLSYGKDTERHRLCALAGALDPASVRVLQEVRVRKGWHCLEIGAGTGTIAQYLLGTVGPSGRVVATELAPSLLSTAHDCGVEVVEHDVVTDNFPSQHFDLVHARCVFEHIGHEFRETALKKVVGWLKPGGWLVVEAAGFESARTDPSSVVKGAVEVASQFFSRAMGTDMHWPRTVPHTLKSLGLRDVGLARSPVLVGHGGPADQVLTLTLRQSEAELIGLGLLKEGFVSRLEQHLESTAAPEPMSTFYSAWGRRPSPASSDAGTAGR